MSTAVVTGAASGIGRALAVRLAAKGYRVHLADVVATEELATELGGVPHRVDVTRPDDMAALADAARDACLVCLNAGVLGRTMGAPWEADATEWERVLRINLMGVVNGLRVFVPRLVDAGEPVQILITASLAGLVTFPGGWSVCRLQARRGRGGRTDGPGADGHGGHGHPALPGPGPYRNVGGRRGRG